MALGIIFFALVQATTASVPQGNDYYCLADETATNLAPDGPAQPLQRCVKTALASTPASGKQTKVEAKDNLNTVYAAAECGDVLLLEPGVTWTGPFHFGPKNCPANKWIIIRSGADDSELPPEETRITPCFAGVPPSALPGRPAFACTAPKNVLPKLLVPGMSSFSISADHLRFVGVEIAAAKLQPHHGIPELVDLEGARHVIFDRCYIHGEATTEVCTALEARKSNFTALIDSWVSEMHGLGKVCLESQTFHAGTGPYGVGPDGPFKVVGNYLESAAQQIFFGGGHADAPSMDIEIRRNHMRKPLVWMPSYKGFLGQKWVVKNQIEAKNAVRMLIEGNIIENVWGGYTQAGYVFTITPKNQRNYTNMSIGMCPNCLVKDVTIRYNWATRAGGLMQMSNGEAGHGDNGKHLAKEGNSYSLHDTVAEQLHWNNSVGGEAYRVGHSLSELSSGASSLSKQRKAEFMLHDVSLDHVTVLIDPPSRDTHMESMTVGGSTGMRNINWTSSIITSMYYGAHGSGGHNAGECDTGKANTPLKLFDACLGEYLISGNVLINDRLGAKKWPAGNHFANNTEAVGFQPGGSYALAPSSPYKGSGLDGKDPGADIPLLLKMIEGVRVDPKEHGS